MKRGGPSKIDKLVVWFLMVDMPGRGPTRTGPAYKSKESANNWKSFVKAAHRGLPTRTARLTLVFHDGALSERSRKTLSEKFNMDADNVRIRPDEARP